MPIPRNEVAGLILIGGKSLRMGQPKALAELAGAPLWRHVTEALAPFVDCVLFQGEVPGFNPPDGYRLLADSPAGTGPLGGIATGLEQSGYTHHLVVAVDYPLVRPGFFSLLLARSGANWAVCARSEAFLEPLIGYYRRDCAGAIRRMLERGETRTHRLYEAVLSDVIHPGEIAKIDPAKWSLFNVNTPSDLQEAEARLKAGYPQ